MNFLVIIPCCAATVCVYECVFVAYTISELDFQSVNENELIDLMA